ncbi:uncharacterized protein Dmoj_GI11161 [Drosophila mojavensis]|uniref:Uncharacterized protein n=1 Tax=Drosophila mojavensis TaxID=7230 RepID=B4L893_DROMO|nr:uncharacterized protein Dmoj_GI11161 [Drosophila mojavensis]
MHYLPQLFVALALCALLSPPEVFGQRNGGNYRLGLRSGSRGDQAVPEGRFTSSVLNKLSSLKGSSTTTTEAYTTITLPSPTSPTTSDLDLIQTTPPTTTSPSAVDKPTGGAAVAVADGLPAYVRRPSEQQWRQYQLEQRNRRRVNRLQREHNQRIRELVRRQRLSQRRHSQRLRRIQQQNRRRAAKRQRRNRNKTRSQRQRRRRNTLEQRRRLQAQRQRRRQRMSRRRLQMLLRRRRGRGRSLRPVVV